MSKISVFSVLAVSLVWLAVVPSKSFASLQRRDAKDKSLKKTNSTERLAALRAQMRANGLSGYFVLATDAHQGEYTALHDKRRQYISGFTGSAGSAVVTLSEAAMWTDGRYYVQAPMEMDSNWILMKASTSGTETETEWLTKKLNKGDVVGVNPYHMSRDRFNKHKKELAKAGIVLKSVLPDLVDKIWTNQPPLPNGTVYILPIEFTGKTWQDKVKDLRLTLKSKSTTAVVLYKLDEVAWLFNLRGSDVPFNPLFYSYAIVSLDKVMLFINDSKLTHDVKNHLHIGDCSSMCVEQHNYTAVLDEIKTVAEKDNSKIWISEYCSHALTMYVNESKLLLESLSPVSLPKAIKNNVEIKGMKRANLKDAVAMCQFAEWMEREVPKGRQDLTELSASAKLEEFKSKQKDYMGPSFFSIFGYGPNAAIIHYSPSKSSDRQISTDSTLLIDTGSQYKDGTCDTSRTFHFGNPTHEQKVAYTRVLKGVIGLGTVIWPNHTQGRFLEILARKELWAGGLDYLHGTGHGVGMFLSVHEGPQAISLGCPNDYERPIVPGMFTSDEPGYYKTGQYGIRLETVMLAVPAKVKSDFPNRYYVTFEPANLTPYERKMILVDMLTKKELDYVNNYHKESREKVGGLMKEQNLMDTYNWLVKKTEPLGTSPSPSGSCVDIANAILVVSGFLVYCLH